MPYSITLCVFHDQGSPEDNIVEPQLVDSCGGVGVGGGLVVKYPPSR